MKISSLYNRAWLMHRVKYKFLVAMKLTTLLLLLGTLHLSAASYSQNITIVKKNTTLDAVFKEIKKQTGYLFFYSEQVDAKNQLLHVSLRNASLKEALDACLSDLGLTYNIINQTVVIKPRPKNAASPQPEQVRISGKVLDEKNRDPLPGIIITIKGKQRNTQTDGNGDFNLVAEKGDVLVISSLGYQNQEITVKDAQITILLAEKVYGMSDVVVTGYQTINKDTYTGTTITINGDDLKKRNPQNLLRSIQSFDPSFKLLDNNLLGSDPNSLPRINVRGATALPGIDGNVLDRNNLSSNYNLPVFILDGFQVTLQKVNDLDINRIESVTLLKDAAATAVYGSRAANGVMVITTKAPEKGKLQLSYNYELNATAPDLSDYHLLNASQKLEYEKLAGLYSSAGNAANTQEELDEMYFAKYKNVVSGVNTYWLSQPLRNAYGNKHSVYAQGGDESFRYGLDLRYQSNPGVMKGSGRDQYSAGMNFNYNPSKKLLFKNEITVTQVNSKNSPYGSFSTYVNMNPYYPKTDSSGRLIQEIANWRIDTRQSGPNQIITRPVYNPLFEASLASFDQSNYLEIIDAFSADWKISKAFRLIGLFSLNKTNNTADRFISPLSSEYADDSLSDIANRGFYSYTTNDRINYDGNLRLLFNKQLRDHYFNLVLGANVISAKSDYKSVEARGFSNDRFTNIGFARTYQPNSSPNGDIIQERSLGSFFSGNYAFMNKYLLDATVRIDGSSAFGANKRFAPFWSTGIGWNLHKEEFIKSLSFISQLKLSASAGLTGSVSFPAYLSKSIYVYQSSNWYSTGIGAIVSGYGNENLEWQKTNNYDAGFDLGLFESRILFSPRYYYKYTKGLLSDINLSPSTGFTTYKENLGNMANEGFEFYLTANAIKTEDWNVNFTANLTHNTNKIVKISNSLKAYNESVDEFQENEANNVKATPLLRFQEGESLNTIYAVPSLGIDPENGREIYVKRDGSLTYDYDVKDTRAVGDMTPRAEGFLGSSITYKRFLLSFSLYYRFGGDLYNQTLVDRVENADPRNNVDSRALEQKWTKPGDVSFYKNIADLGTTYATSRFVQKDNQLNLQSVYLSYDFRPEPIKKLGFRTLRAAITANDVFRTSSIEIERGINYPFARSVNFSLQATF